MSNPHGHETELDLTDPALSREELARLNAELAEVEVHSKDRYPIPGTKRERAAERQVAACFLLTFLASAGFVVAYVAMPWRFGDASSYLYTPVLGVLLGIALCSLGAGAILWAKKLMPHEEAVQVRHDGPSSEGDRRAVAAQLLEGLDGTGIGRRKLLQRSLGLGALGVGVLAVVPLVGGMIVKPGNSLFETPWKKGVRLVREDGTPVRPADMRAGSLMTVFPGVPGVPNNPHYADAPTMLIRFRPGTQMEIPAGRESWHYEDFFAYSKICTHAGCPVSLYEQQTQRMLCPCHQSQFLMTDGARPVFGPATRPLPQLPIGLDDEGYFIALSDYQEAVGPAFWERP